MVRLWFVFVVIGLFFSTDLLGTEQKSQGSQSIHIHIDDPTFRAYSVLIPTRNIEGLPGTETDKKPKRVGAASQLREFSSLMGKLLEGSRFFDLQQLALYAPPAFSWPQVEKTDANSLKNTLTDWAARQSLGKDSVGKDSVGKEGRLADLILFSHITAVSFRRHRLEVFLVDMTAQKVSLTRTITWRTRAKFREHIYRLADEILKQYSQRPGLYSSRIVFTGKEKPDSVKQIYSCRMDGSDLQKITTDPVIHLSPAWSSDGKKILFTSYLSGNPDLYVYTVDDGSTQSLSSYEGLDSGGAADPQSNWVAFSGLGDSDADLFMVSMSGGPRRLLLKGVGLDVDPTFSRDGKYLAFVSGRFGNPHIFVAELKRSLLGSLKVVKDRRLTWAGWYNGNPAFSWDSQKIAFAGFDKEIGRFDLFLMDVDGRNLERLTLKSGDNESPSWSPNDQLLVFHSSRVVGSQKKGPPALYIMRRDGALQKKIPLPLYSAETPSWGPPVW